MPNINQANLLKSFEDRGIEPRIAARFGRSLRLNGDDEFAHILDASITPTDAFDILATGAGTIGIHARVLRGFTDQQAALIAKRADADDTSANAGWILELTADNNARFFVDDNTVAPVEISTANDPGVRKTLNDTTHHMIFVTWDRSTDTIALYWSPGKNPWQLRQAETASIAALGSAGNAVPLAIGAATSNGSTFTTPAGLEVAWVAVWDEALTLEQLRAITRFQLPVGDGPAGQDRRLVSCYHFSNFDGSDWNTDNGNDLTLTSIDRDNYVPGPERFGIIESFQVQPSMGSNPGRATIAFHRFRPHALSEGFYKIIGKATAPPLRWRRTTKNAISPPIWGTVGSTVGINRRYAAVMVDAVAQSEFRIYDAIVDEENTAFDSFAHLGSIAASAALVPASDHIIFDRSGIAGYCWFMNDLGDLKTIDITDPTSPSVDNTLAITNGADVLHLDTRDNGFLYLLSNGANTLSTIDVSDPTAPTLDNQLTATLGTGCREMSQDGDRLYVGNAAGVAIVDISTPGSPSIVNLIRHDPIDTFNSRITAVLENGLVMSFDNQNPANIYLLDTLENADDPPVSVVATDVDYNEAFHASFLERAAVLIVYHAAGSTHRCTATNLTTPASATRLATYTLDDYTKDDTAAQAMAAFAGDHMIVGGNSNDRIDLYKFDAGEGFSALELKYPIGLAAIDNPRPLYEHRTLISDLTEDDFEDDAPAALPTGWTKIGGANSTAAVSAERGLTGQVPGSLTPPQSLLLDLGGADVTVGVRKDYNIVAADQVPGTPFLLSFFHLLQGAGGLDIDTDFVVTIEERPSGTSVAFPLSTGEHTERWLPNDFVYELLETNTTAIRITLSLENTSTYAVFIDSLRLGPGRLPLAFAGRVMKTRGGEAEVGGMARTYTATMVDKTFDFNRTPVGTTVPADAAATSLATLVTDNTRADDRFDTDNVFDALGSHDEIAIDADSDPRMLSDLFAEILEQAGGTYHIDYFGKVWAYPIGYLPAPIAINDVLFGWISIEDTMDGGDLVTEVTALGDRSASTPVSGSATHTRSAARLGEIAHTFASRTNLTEGTTAQALANFFRDLHGDYQYEGRIIVEADDRLRPGQLLPLQLDGRAIDRVVLISSVMFASPGPSTVLATITYSLLQETFAARMLRDRNENRQRGKKQYPQQIVDALAWNEE